MRRTTLVPIALALVLGILLSGAVAARSPSLVQPQPMVDLWMSDVSDGPEKLNFLPGTTQAYIVVRYTNASNTEYRIEVLDDSGGLVFQKSKTYTGSDTDSILLTGDDIFQAYQDRVGENGTVMTQAVADAKTELEKEHPSRTEALEYVTTAKLAASAMGAAIERIRDYTIPPDADSHFQQALADLALVESEADAAISDLNESDFAGALSHVQAMETHAADAVSHATQGLDALGDGGERPFLETGLCAPNTTKIVDVATGSAADSESWSVGTPGSPFYMFPGPKAMDLGKAGEIAASPSTIYASTVTVPSAVHSTAILAMVTDDHCIPVEDGTQVSFSASDPALGTVSPETATTVNGVVTTTLTAGAQVDGGTVTVSATAGDASGSVPVTLIGPPDSVWVRTSHTNIAIGGQEVTVQAEVRDQNRHLVADGTEVTFSLEPSGLGSWLTAPITNTVKGWATAKLTSGDTTGAATVRATADSASGTADIRFVGPVHSLTVTADPTEVFVFGTAPFTEIEVQAQDADGYPAPDGTMVTFDLEPPYLGTFTDRSVALDDGRATTRLEASGEMGLATVTAQADAVSDSVQVRFRGFEIYLPLLFKNYP